MINHGQPDTTPRTSHLTRLVFAIGLSLAALTACGGGGEDDGGGGGSGLCTSDDDCVGDLICIVSIGQCGECATDDDCAAGQACRAQLCVSRTDASVEDTQVTEDSSDDADTTTTDSGADTEAPDVAPDVPEDPCMGACVGLQQCDRASGSCVSPPICTADQDCVGIDFCFRSECTDPNTIPDQELGCITTMDCELSGYVCNTARHVCEPLLPNSCTTDTQCPGSLVCDTFSGRCVACTVDNNCPGGLVCDQTFNSPTRFQCIESDRCNFTEDCSGDRTCNAGTCAEPACTGDDFADNATCDAAADLGGSATWDAQEICGESCDWYSIPVEAGDGLLARVVHDPRAGDLDVALYSGPCQEGGADNLLQRSARDRWDEVVSLSRSLDTTNYLLEVCPFVVPGVDEGTNSYDLEVWVVEGGFCADDLYDVSRSNDEAPQASVITVTQRPFNFVSENLQICGDESDWYRVGLNAGDLLLAEIEHPGQLGDLDMELYAGLPNADSEPILISATEGVTTETLAAVSDVAGDAFIRVFSRSGDPNSYTLSVTVSDGCADRFEPEGFANESDATATDLTPLAPVELLNLRLCENDVDWYELELENNMAAAVQIIYDENAGTNISAQIIEQSGGQPRTVPGSSGLLTFVAIPSGTNRVLFGLQRPDDVDLLYTMRVAILPADQACVDDVRNNGSFDLAFPSMFGVREYRGRICPGTEAATSDFFFFGSIGASRIHADLIGGDDDVELELLGAAEGNVIASGAASELGLSATANFSGGDLYAVVRGANPDADADYTLQVYTEPNTAECGDDRFDQSGSNNTWEQADRIPSGQWTTNLMLCPNDASDWYTFNVLGSIGLTITIQTHTFADAAITARVYGTFGPPFDLFMDTTASENGSLQLSFPWYDVFDGGDYAIEIMSDSDEPVWYDIRVVSEDF